MSRQRFFVLFAALIPFVALWTSCANGPGAEPGAPPADPKTKLAIDVAFEWQSRVICDWPELPAFSVGDLNLPVPGNVFVVAIPKAGQDPAASEELKTHL